MDWLFRLCSLIDLLEGEIRKSLIDKCIGFWQYSLYC
jgi:hypothetical protein